jgi:hypothetical protein
LENQTIHNDALCKVAELTAEAKQTIEVLLGRSLQENEAIRIHVYQPTPTREAREEASRRLLKRIDRTAARAQDISEDEIEAAIDEAVNYVRHHPG